eukprot:GDKI01049479.1.p1 GENE.GDKI01049479.1~~GDKI01049479.1.p1  ORF type:complete len:277 (+),score=46.84 GDKI01049479.1:129-959(+)
MRHTSQHDFEGFWSPHTASVDFCEPNYAVTHYIAEPHNVWSSGVFVAFGILGAIYANPTKEMMFTFYYLVLTVTGLGSMALHATLDAMWQSSDEVPMLWLNIAVIIILFEVKSTPKGTWRSRAFTIFMLLLGVVQTVLYYTLQSFYHAFLASFIISLVILSLGVTHYAFEDQRPDVLPLRRNLWLAASTCGIYIGAVTWIFEMTNCEWLIAYYIPVSGLTLHIVWHLGAAWGTYLATVMLSVVRIQALGMHAALKWRFGFLPVAVIVGGEDGKKMK